MIGALNLCTPPLGAHTHIHTPPAMTPTSPLYLQGVTMLGRGPGYTGGRVCTRLCMCGVERGVKRTHLPQYYCQSIIPGNARRMPWGRVHYVLTTGSVLVTRLPCVIVCLGLCVCIFMHVSAWSTIEGVQKIWRCPHVRCCKMWFLTTVRIS